MQSARRASEVHMQRTGKSLRITESIVINEEMYEEVDLQYAARAANYERWVERSLVVNNSAQPTTLSFPEYHGSPSEVSLQHTSVTSVDCADSAANRLASLPTSPISTSSTMGHSSPNSSCDSSVTSHSLPAFAPAERSSIAGTLKFPQNTWPPAYSRAGTSAGGVTGAFHQYSSSHPSYMGQSSSPECLE